MRGAIAPLTPLNPPQMCMGKLVNITSGMSFAKLSHNSIHLPKFLAITSS